MANKRIIISKNAQLNPNGTIHGSNKILYDDYNCVDDLMTSLGEYFATGKVTGTSHLSKIISKDFDTIEKDIKSNKLASLDHIRDLMGIVSQVSDYQEAKRAGDKDYAGYLIYKTLFPWQRNVFQDYGHRISLLCGRRSGKTILDIALMVRHCLDGSDNTQTDNGVIRKFRQAVYIGLTFTKAMDTIWDPLKDFIKQWHIPVSKIDNGAGVVTFSNGATIMVLGNSSKPDREKIRGADSSMYVIDEMQSQQGLNYLMTNIIGPIVKGRNGYIVCSGTAPLVAGGKWEMIQTDSSWSHYHATMADNPSIPDYETALVQVLAENGWDESNITYKREYLGKIAYDTDRLIIKSCWYYSKDLIKDKEFANAVLAVDYGYADDSAWALIVQEKTSGNWYLVGEYSKCQMSSKDIETKTVEFANKALEYVKDKGKVWIVGDSSHEMMLRTIYNDGWYNTETPNKTNESQQWIDLNEACQTGALLVEKDGLFDTDAKKLSWQVDPETNYVVYKVDDKLNHELRVSDLSDALKYGWQKALSL